MTNVSSKSKQNEQRVVGRARLVAKKRERDEKEIKERKVGNEARAGGTRAYANKERKSA